jgi:diguanylate cyclase (GGDEF)-like protein
LFVDCIWLALDIDNFKPLNDEYGHPAVDELLEKMGNLLNKKVEKKILWDVLEEKSS